MQNMESREQERTIARKVGYEEYGARLHISLFLLTITFTEKLIMCIIL